jgi:hypothetical protein
MATINAPPLSSIQGAPEGIVSYMIEQVRLSSALSNLQLTLLNRATCQSSLISIALLVHPYRNHRSYAACQRPKPRRKVLFGITSSQHQGYMLLGSATIASSTKLQLIYHISRGYSITSLNSTSTMTQQSQQLRTYYIIVHIRRKPEPIRTFSKLL